MKCENLRARRVGRLLGALVMIGASGLSLAAIDLNPTFSGPATYTPGTSGVSYTLTVANDGSDPETDATVATDFPASVTVSWTCTADTNSNCAAASGTGNLSGGGFGIENGESLTFAILADYDSAMTDASLEVAATVDDSATPSIRTTDSATSTLELESDLTLAKSSPDSAYTPGESSTFTVTVANAGPSDSAGVELEDPAPAGTTISGWTCTPTSACPAASGSAGDISEMLAIPAGETATFTVTVDYPSSLQAETSTNTATMTVPADLNDPDGSAPIDRSASLDRAAESDLRLSFTGTGPTEFTPGATPGVEIEFTIANDGPSDTTGAALPLRWGDFVTTAAWSCDPLDACEAEGEITVPDTSPGADPNDTVQELTGNTPGAGAGTGDEDLIIDLVDGGSVVITANLEFASGARSDYVFSPQVFASAEDPPTAADEPDPDVDNNTATLTLAPDRQADIAVDKIGLTTVNPGSSFAYDIIVSNLGPSDVGDDPLVQGSAGETGILLEDLFDPSLLGGLSECADPSAPCWRACSSDSDGADGTTEFDLDNCPTTLISSGGDIQDLRITLKAGHSTLVRAFVRTDENASGQVINEATVSLDPADDVVEPAVAGVTDNNTDTVTSNIDRSTDLAVTKTDGVTTAVAGEQHSYTIVVENTGFITANNVVLEDELPIFDETDFANGIDSAGFVPDSVEWQCEAFEGACCNTNSTNCGAGQPTEPTRLFPDPLDGSVLLSNGVDLPGRSRVEFTVTGTLDGRASGTLSNTAEIFPPATVNDPAGDTNDIATDDDTLLVRQAAITVTKSLTSVFGVDAANPDSPPFALTYAIVVENNGPSFVPGVEVIDPLSDTDFNQSTADWECAVEINPGQTACSAPDGTGTLDTAVDIDPGGQISFIVRVETEATASGSVTNTARVELPSGEQFFSEAVRTSLIGTAELAITKTDNRDEVAPGDPVTYNIRVTNEGPDDVLNANVVDEFPLVIDSLTWSCEAVTPVPGDITPLRPLVPGFTPGNGLVTSPDGRHVYVIGTSTGRLFAFDRNNVPGAGFGDVTLIETEINGVDDTGDAGAVVSGMDRPLDIAMSPDGLNVYALSKPETVPEFGFVEQFANSRWSTATQTFGCGGSSVSADSASVELNTANGCAAIFAGYTHDGADEAGTVTFDWSLEESQAHVYVAQAGVAGETLQTLSAGTPGTGTVSIAVVPGDQITFAVSKSSGFGISTLRISNFEFTPADAAPPTLVAFSRSTDPAAANFGELLFLGSFSEGLPEEPTSLSMRNGNLYVSGAGNPNNQDDDGNPIADSDVLISIFERDPISGLPVHDFIQLADVPSDIQSLAVAPAGDYLFAGGDSLQMFTIDEAQAGLPAGRLTPVDNLAFGVGINSLVAVDDAPHLYGRAEVGSAPTLFMVRYLDPDDDSMPLLSLEFQYTAAGLGLPATAFSSAGSIAVSPDGEHVAGVSADDDLLYILRRDDNPEPGGGGLSFQESRANEVANDENSGLILATDVIFAPDGRHVLVAPAADADSTNPALAVFNRRAPEPLFAFLENDRQSDADVTGIRAPNDIAVSPDGAHVYAVSLPDNSLTRFDRFPRLGLTEASAGLHLQYAETYSEGINGFSGLAQPRRILISPDGNFVFVTSEANDTVAVFERIADDADPDFGKLKPFQVIVDGDGAVDGLNGAQGLAMDAASRHLYVAGSFDNAIARFERSSPDGHWEFRERVVAGEDGVVGLSGIRDIAVTFDGSQLFGVSTNSNALVVFDRDSDSGSSTFGELTFVQAQLTSIGVRPVALALPNGSAALGRDAHVYVVGQNSNTLAVLRRVTDPSSSAFGQVQPIDLLTSGQDGIAFMQGPTDVQVSPDGKRVYVAAEASDSVLVFDRDLNVNSSRFGVVSPVEIRRDSVRGVDGIRGVRALGVSADSRNVYAAGFGEGAVASFRLGTGSVCTAGGSGTIDDLVDIGVGGTIEYRATGVVRPGATGTLVNTASIAVPENFIAIAPQTSCPNGGDYCATDTTELVPEGTVSMEKTADAISFVAGETASYTVTINNSGPSSLVHSAGSPLTVNDPLDDNDAFVDGSAVWRCEATGSGSLEFLDAYRNIDPEDPTTGPFDSLQGISGLALVPGSPGNWLVGASVLDDSLSVFTRDPVTGELLTQTTLSAGDTLDGQLVDFLNGVQSVVASDDGAFIYLASRVSDSVTVLSLGEDVDGDPVFGFVQSIDSIGLAEPGLDQAVQVVLSADPSQSNVYVAGANDDAIAVFERDETSGELTWVQSVQEGFGGVTGLLDVSYLVLSDDGLHLYALSPTGASIALFDRDSDGLLSLRRTYDGADLGVSIDGVSSAVLDADNQYLYVAAELASRIVVLERDSSTGELVLRSSVAQGEDGVNGLVGVRQLAITSDAANPDNVHVYATSQATSSVAWFIRDASDGSLAFGGLRGNQSSTPTGLGGATGIVVDEFLKQVIVAGTAEASLSRFQRQADSFCPASGTGELENVPFNIGAGGSVTFFIEVELASDFTGIIDPGTNENTGTVENVATLVADADPLNSTQSSTATSVLDTVADLVITKTDNLREFDGLAGAAAIAGTNTHVYTGAPDDNGIGMFARNVDPGQPGHGRLEFRQAAISGEGDFEGINDVADLALSSDGRQAYAASTADNSVVVLDLDPASGEMAFGEIQQNGVFGVGGLSGASAIAVSPDDAHVYALGAFSNAIVSFARQTDEMAEDFGRLTFLEFDQNGVGGVAGMGAPVALALSDDGRHVYVAGEENDTLAVFERNRLEASANFGRLEYVTHYTNNTLDADEQPIAAGMGGIRDVAVSADGTTVYVLGAEVGTLARFARDPVTGELDFVDFLQDGGNGGLAGARSVLLDDLSLSLYVAGEAAGAITRLQIDLADGALTFAGQIANGDPAPATGGSVFGLEGVTALFQSLDGDHVYAASSGRDAVLTFALDASPSSLAFEQIIIDGLGGVAPGDPVEYVIRVSNLGPSDVPQARVIDLFPESFDSVQWSCSPDGNPDPAVTADCLPGVFAGDVDAEVQLSAGASATIRATGVVSAAATGRLINTASILADGVQDPFDDNNSATDDDTVLSPASDLVMTVDNGVDELVPGGMVGYDVGVRNNGPSSVRGVFVEDAFPAALFDTRWSCIAVPAAGILDDPLDADLGFVPSALAISGDGRWAYAVGGNFIEVIRRDALTGSLDRDPVAGTLDSVQQIQNAVGGVFGIGGGTDAVISADGRFVYVAGGDSDSIALFERDGTTGELEFVDAWFDGQGTTQGIGGINRLLLSADGNQLYAAGSLDNALAIFTIDSVTGRLDQTGFLEQGVDGVDGLAGITDMILAADDSLLLVVAEANQSLTTFQRDSADGGLAWVDTLLNDDLIGTPAENSLLGAVSIIEADDEILVASRLSDLVGRFALVTEIEAEIETTLPVPTGLIDAVGLGESLISPLDLAWDSDQARLYIAAPGEVLLLNLIAEAEVVERYSAADPDYSLLTGLSSLSLSPSGRHLQTLGTQADAEIGIWARERGSRCPLSGTGDLGRQQVDIVAGGELLYRVEGTIQPNATGRLRYTVGVENPAIAEELNPGDNSDFDDDPLTPAPDLAVTKSLDTAPVIAGLPVSWSIGFDNAGLSDAVLANLIDEAPVFPSPGGILADSGSWTCDANDPLSSAVEFALPDTAAAIAVDSDNGFLYATSAANDALLVFPLLPDGTPDAPTRFAEGDIADPEAPDVLISGLGGASDVAVSGDGLHVYVTGETGNSLVVFGREAAGAPLEYLQTFTTKVPTTIDSVPGLRGARSVVLSGDERFVFVAGSISNAVAVFERDPQSGQLTYVERVVDGVGTIVPEFNVIRSVSALHATGVGNDLYAIADDSEAISRFSFNRESGVLTFESVLRAQAPIPDLAGIRDLAASPGDTNLYVLVDAGIAIFSRRADGSLEFESLFDVGPGLIQPTALLIDRAGSRAYLLDEGAGAPVIHVLRRDWADGALEFWFTQPIIGGAPRALVQQPGQKRLLVAGDGPSLLRFEEQALSRCLTDSMAADGIDTEVDLGATGASTFALDATVHPSARGTLDNSATATPADGADPDSGNNTASVSAPIEVVSDIAVSKAGPAEAVAGEPIAYQITVTNAGPSSALGIVITDIAPAALEQIEWACAASDGSSCPATGTGAPTFSADVLPNGQLDIVLEAVIDSAFIGLMTNGVELTPEADATDPTPGDHTDSVETEVIAVADVSVDKTTLTAEVVAGLPVSWRLDVANAGPSDAPSVDLVDTLPLGLGNVAWTCSAADGASCPASGIDALDFNAALPAGSSLEIFVDADVSPASTGSLVNDVLVSVDAPVNEPDLSNNSATTSDPIEVRSDMTVEVIAPRNPFDPAGPIELPVNVLVTNLGPSNSRNVDVTTEFSASVVQTNPGCTQPTPTRVRCLVSQLDPAEARTLELSLTDLPPAPATLVVDSLVITSSDDLNPLNDTDSETIELLTGIDLDVSVDNGFTWLSPGQVFEYLIRIDNFGSVDAAALDVAVPVPAELLDAEWTCTPTGSANCSAADLGEIVDVATVPSGDSVTYRLSAQVDPLIDLSVPRSVTLTASAEATPPDDEINPANNIGVDQDEIRLIMFADGFESDPAIPPRTQSVEPGASCLSIDFDRDSSSAATPLRLLEARSAAGDAVAWLDLSRRGNQPWLQLSAMTENGLSASGWTIWPEGERVLAIRIEDGRAALVAGQATLWDAPGRLADELSTVRRSALRDTAGVAPMFGVGRCDDSAIELGGAR